MAILKINDDTVRRAAELISRGGLVAFPTETVYGLGADAFNPAALAKIFETKNRPRFDPLIVHIAAVDALEKVADLSLLDMDAKKKLDLLVEKFWPGPLTLILPKQPTVPDLATSGLSTVAVRIPDLDAARQLIALSTGAVAAPSANPFGYLSPTSAEHVQVMLGDEVEIILDGGPTRVGLESTVLDICHGQPRILRPGGVPKEALEDLIGPLASGPALNDSGVGGAASPGMMKNHYAPRARLTAHETLVGISYNKDSAFLFFDGASRDEWLKIGKLPGSNGAIAVLSESGNITEAAARFFQSLYALDRPEISRIYAQLAPAQGLGAAINDRLRRASN